MLILSIILKSKSNTAANKRILNLIVRNYHTIGNLNSIKAYLPFNVKPTLGYKTLILKRTMFTSRVATKTVNMNLIRNSNPVGVLGNKTQTSLGNKPSLKNIQRNVPGQGYDAGRYIKDARTATGRKIPQHEETHVNIIDKETSKNVALFSSCKKPGFSFIASENIKNDVLPNGSPKEQWAIPFKTPRCHDQDIFEADKVATSFANKHQKELDAMLYKTNTHNKEPLKRVHKDAGELYHENGQLIFDANGNEIEYD